jgi:hypothetical protein
LRAAWAEEGGVFGASDASDFQQLGDVASSPSAAAQAAAAESDALSPFSFPEVPEGFQLTRLSDGSYVTAESYLPPSGGAFPGSAAAASACRDRIRTAWTGGRC